MSLKLWYSPASPFVRKVLVFAHEAGLEDSIALVPGDVWAPETEVTKDNPLGKVPALVTPDGVFAGSYLCCEYLDTVVLREGRRAADELHGDAVIGRDHGHLCSAQHPLVELRVAALLEKQRSRSVVEREDRAVDESLPVLEVCGGARPDRRYRTQQRCDTERALYIAVRFSAGRRHWGCNSRFTLTN